MMRINDIYSHSGEVGVMDHKSPWELRDIAINAVDGVTDASTKMALIAILEYVDRIDEIIHTGGFTNHEQSTS